MFQIDVLSRKPVYEQIVSQMERFVLTGVLAPGAQLPSVRSLSVDLAINPNTIQRAYTELDRKGVICSVPGKGCFVSESAVKVLSEIKREKLVDLKELVWEMKLAGVTLDELLLLIHEVYEEKEVLRA
ncbi:MAG: GntR family transcriptional regulator [Lachnospiraceae bacterium]|nr:GntR family transcriptional regulator [Lachnospiraceae bacterium]